MDAALRRRAALLRSTAHSRLRASERLRWTQIAAFALLAAPFLFTLASLADLRRCRFARRQPAGALAAAALARRRRWRSQICSPAARTIRARAVSADSARRHSTAHSCRSSFGARRTPSGRCSRCSSRSCSHSSTRFAARAASRWFVPALAALISVTLLVCGGFYTASEERLSYVELARCAGRAFGVSRSLPACPRRGRICPNSTSCCATPQANIPQDDGLILIPGEDPFYFATGRVPRFPVLLFDPTTDPYSPAETAALVRSDNIRWLIVKRDLQINEDPTPDRAATMQAADGRVHAGGAPARVRCVPALNQRNASASILLSSPCPTASALPNPSPSGRRTRRQTRRSLQRNASPVPM